MAEITCQFVRPDRLLYEGKVEHVVLITPRGEFGVWPLHAPEIVTLGDGVVRLACLPEDGGDTVRIIISGGYAEIANDTVIVLADHARRTDDIDIAQTEGLLEAARAKAAALDEDDNRRAYWEQKAKWFALLLKYAER